MKSYKLALLAVGVTLSSLTGTDAAPYVIDADHSDIVFKVKHLGISTVTGRFERFSGSLDIDPANLGATKTSATIEAASINTDVSKRDDHLRSADFFDTAQFPQIKFVTGETENIQGNTFDIVGDLTLHGVTKRVTLNATLGGVAKDPWGNQRVAVSASTRINRKDFGLGWNQVLETGGLLVGESIEIVLEVEAILQAGK